MGRRFLHKNLGMYAAAAALAIGLAVTTVITLVIPGCKTEKKINILFITSDDMNWDSPGFMGCQLPDITPNLDRLAREGFVFSNAHIVTPICGPSRNAMHTGRYPHQTGMMGHGIQPPEDWEPRKEIPSLNTVLKEAGYMTGMFGKGGARGDRFDVNVSGAELGWGRAPDKFYEYTSDFLERAKQSGKPFFLYANPQDPHRYWPRTHEERNPEWWKAQMKKLDDYKIYPSGLPWPDPKVSYDPDQVPLPACYPDIPRIREHIPPYYDAVNRFDDCTGAILKALGESGMEDNTMVVYMSDHGMGWAFAKWSLYPYGTRSPIIFKCPGKIPQGKMDTTHVVSAVDLYPTILTAAGLTPLEGIDGRPLNDILEGNPPGGWREAVYTSFTYMNNLPDQENHGYYPMRAMIGKRYVYIWNTWHDGEKQVPVTMGRVSKPVMFMEEHPDFKGRADFYRYRVPHEFYDIEKDPGCWNNLIDSNEYQDNITHFQDMLFRVMRESEDPELDKYRIFLGGS
jgi:N-sulfoglucosamine sulfohydrolase